MYRLRFRRMTICHLWAFFLKTQSKIASFLSNTRKKIVFSNHFGILSLLGPLSTYWILLEDFKTRWPLQHFFHSFRWDKFKIIFSPITGSNGPLFETSPKFRPKCDFSYFRDKHYFWTPNYIIYELLKVNFVHYVGSHFGICDRNETILTSAGGIITTSTGNWASPVHLREIWHLLCSLHSL